MLGGGITDDAGNEWIIGDEVEGQERRSRESST